jgi:hypothetical protein
MKICHNPSAYMQDGGKRGRHTHIHTHTSRCSTNPPRHTHDVERLTHTDTSRCSITPPQSHVTGGDITTHTHTSRCRTTAGHTHTWWMGEDTHPT